MLKNNIICCLVLASSAYGKYVTEDQIVKDKRSFQVSSCKDRQCVSVTQKQIESQDHITTYENGYYVTYIVNLDAANVKNIQKKFQKKFPDMILKKQNSVNKELLLLKSYKDDFNKHKNFKTKVKTKSLNIYDKPINTSKILERKKNTDIIYIDGCNVYDWCKQKDKNRYFALNSITLLDNTSKKNTTIATSFIAKYKQSLESFKKKDYEKAYALLNELFQEKSDDLNVNFYLGRSAYETKRYDESVSAYERFLFEKPDNNPVKLEMARAFFMTKTYKESKKLLLEVKKDPKVPKTTLVVVDYYLHLIDGKISKHFVNGVLMVGVNYDSNINSKSKHDTYNNVYIPALNVYLNNVSNSVEKVDNWYNQEIALINYKYKMSDNKEIKQDFMIFNKDSFDSKYDTTKVTLLSYSPALSIKYNKQLTVNYALYTDFLKYGGKDKLKTFALFPKINYIYNSTNTFAGHIKYQIKKDQQDSTKNSTYTEAATTLNHIYTKKLALSSNVTFTNEKVKDTTQTGIDYNAVKGSLALNFKYKPVLFFAPSLAYTITNYKDIDSSYKVKTENKQLKFAFASTYIYSAQWILQSTVDYTTQSSNIQKNEYDKYTFGLNLIRPF